MSTGVLEGLSVADLAVGIAGPYCAKLLADMGATVIKVETGLESPPLMPRLDGEPQDLRDHDWSFLACNTDKLGITLDHHRRGGLDLLVRVLAQVDVVVVDPESPYWDTVMGLQSEGSGFAELGNLITVVVSSFGQTGPYAGRKALHLNTFHGGGEGYLLPGGLGFELFPDRPPIQAGGHIAEYDAGLASACATVAAVLQRDAGGGPVFVDVSKQDVQVTLGRQYITTLDSAGVVESRASRAYSAAGMFVCSDGWTFIYASEDHFWGNLADLIGRPEWKSDPRFSTRPIRTENWPLAEPAVVAWAAERTQQEVYEACRGVGIPASIYKLAPDILQSDSLRARGFFSRLQREGTGALDYPGLGFTIDGRQVGPRHAAPRLGEHNLLVFGDMLGLDAIAVDWLRASAAVDPAFSEGGGA
jgi:crotonobetainyl-CoA:carnitine CoA-transferase CaiB-like acyl-CoA transferase